MLGMERNIQRFIMGSRNGAISRSKESRDGRKMRVRGFQISRFQRNSIPSRWSVDAVIMSGEVVSRLFLCPLTFFFLLNFSRSSGYDSCLNVDMAEMEDYLSKLNVENVTTIDRMVGGLKGPVTALPFGALQSDWARLLLLIKRTQPNDTVLAEKLARLFRILRVAYFRTEKYFDQLATTRTSWSSRFDESSESTSPSTTELFTARNATTLTVEFSKPAVVASKRRKLTKDFATSREFNTANVPASRELILPITESSISTFHTSTESISRNVNDSIPTFAITDPARLTTLTGYKKSITGNVEDKQTTNRKSIFAPEVGVTTSEVKGAFDRTKGRGDFSIFHDSDANTRSTEDRSRFVTMQYRNVADRNIAEFGNDTDSQISKVQSANRPNYIYNNVVRDFQNISSNKVIFTYPRSNNDFWKYIGNYRNVPFASSTTARSISETDNSNGIDGNLAKFKKRDSFNGNREQNFRWFSNFVEKDTRVRNLPANSPTINIECNGRADGK